MTRFALLFATTILAGAPALAEEVGVEGQQVAERPQSDYHQEEEQGIVVTANFVRDLNLLAGTSVLSGTDLV